MQNYRSKSETAIIVADCLKYHRFQFFRRSVGFFRCFVVIFPPFQHRQTRAKADKYKTCSQAEKHVASNNS